jgi:hypothetical protein
VHQKEDPQQDLPADQKVALPQVVILTAHAMIAVTQELLASSEVHATIQVPHVHRVPNHPIVFQQIVNHLMGKENHIKEEIVNHSIVITAKVVSVVPSGIVSLLTGSASHTKEEIVNHSIAITAKEANAVPSEIANLLMGKENRLTAKAANASLLAELKTQHVHPIKEIIAGIAMRPLR